MGNSSHNDANILRFSFVWMMKTTLKLCMLSIAGTSSQVPMVVATQLGRSGNF
jgi:hypothetical protein